MLWGVLPHGVLSPTCDEASSNATSLTSRPRKSRKKAVPVHLVYTRQCRHALLWLHAFLSGQRGGIERTFASQTYENQWLTIATDASPWGFGGVLLFHNTPVAWFADTPSQDDSIFLDAKTGDPGYNTVWEALAILVALRTWRKGFHQGLSLEVKSDSMASIQVIFKLSSSSPALNLIAREIALDTAEFSSTIELLTHIPGVANVIPDHLSRLQAPEPHQFPESLHGVPQAQLAPRNKSFWTTLLDPLA